MGERGRLQAWKKIFAKFSNSGGRGKETGHLPTIPTPMIETLLVWALERRKKAGIMVFHRQIVKSVLLLLDNVNFLLLAYDNCRCWSQRDVILSPLASFLCLASRFSLKRFYALKVGRKVIEKLNRARRDEFEKYLLYLK